MALSTELRTSEIDFEKRGVYLVGMKKESPSRAPSTETEPLRQQGGRDIRKPAPPLGSWLFLMVSVVTFIFSSPLARVLLKLPGVYKDYPGLREAFYFLPMIWLDGAVLMPLSFDPLLTAGGKKLELRKERLEHAQEARASESQALAQGLATCRAGTSKVHRRILRLDP